MMAVIAGRRRIAGCCAPSCARAVYGGVFLPSHASRFKVTTGGVGKKTPGAAGTHTVPVLFVGQDRHVTPLLYPC